MSEQNKRVVVSFIEAFSRGDTEAAKPCLAPDAVTIAKGFGKQVNEYFCTILADQKIGPLLHDVEQQREQAKL